jgi:outer membrane receptor protein involved in Fe transport
VRRREPLPLNTIFWCGPAAALLVVAGAAGAAEGAADRAPPESSVFPSETDGVAADELRRLAEGLAAAEAPAAPASRPAGGLANPDLALIVDLVGAYHTEDPLPSGVHDPGSNGFHFQHLELAAGGAADPYFRFDAYLMFGPSSVEVEEAFATTLALPANLQLRAGQFLTRFGRINATHPHAWNFVDVPLAVGRFLGPHGSRGLGVEGSWLAPLPWFAELSVSAHGPAASGHGHEGEESDHEAHALEDPGDLVYVAALKQFFSLHDDWGLLLGVSTEQGPEDDHGQRSSIYGADLHLRYRPVADTDRSALALQVEGLVRDTEEHRGYGGYAQLVWSVDPEWETGVRYDWVSGGGDEPLAPEHAGERHRAAAQLTYHPSHFSRLRLQVNRDAPEGRPTFWAALLQLEVAIGAHGAHAY